MRCLGRRTFVSKRRHFGDGEHWVYAESRCEKVVEGGSLCRTCKNRSAIGANGKKLLQAQPGFPHGICGKEIPRESQIYGGKWYEEGVKKWGEPLEEDLNFLKESSQNVMKTLDQYFREAKKDNELVKAMEGVVLEEKPKLKGRPARKKKEVVPMNAEKENGSGVIVAMEVDEEAVVPEEVEEIMVRPITIKGKEYYWEPNKEKVYGKGAGGAIGEYLGRLKDGAILEGVPDSDEDCCV